MTATLRNLLFQSYERNIQFRIIENDERSALCGKHPDAYATETKTAWDNSVARKIRSDCDSNTSGDPQPVVDFDNNTALAYLPGLQRLELFLPLFPENPKN
jgi:hypothetical protein